MKFGTWVRILFPGMKLIWLYFMICAQNFMPRNENSHLGANPTIVRYNASTVKFTTPHEWWPSAF
jgi:hypothetical protein